MDGDAGVERDSEDNGSTRSMSGVNGDMGDMERVCAVFILVLIVFSGTTIPFHGLLVQAPYVMNYMRTG